MQAIRSGNEAAVRPGASNPEFEKLAERTFKFVIASDPVKASWLGLHGRHDATLPDRSLEAAEAAMTGFKQLQHEFELFDPRRLSPEQQTELSLTQGALGAQIALEERRPSVRMLPQLYLQDCADGIYLPLARDYAPLEARARALLGRLKGVSALLEQGKRNLDSPPPLFTQSAVLTAQGLEDLLRHAVPAFLRRVNEASLSHQCERAAGEALRAVESYHEFLLGSLMTRSRGEFRVGKVTFNRLLRDQHMIPFDADELVVLGEKVYHETLREVRATAARIRPGYNWSRLLQQLQENHPTSDGLAAAYTSSIQAARRFVEERKLVGLPAGESCEVVPTPAFARPFFPYAGYLAPGPFEERQRGLVWVTPVDPSESDDRQESVMRGHSVHGIPVLAVHEAYPGHHLQLVHAARTGRKLRSLFTTPLLAEGWALYCEEMMYEAGFLRDDRVRLLQLRDQLWRACRVIVDVGLHTGKMSFNEAAGFLVRKAKLERGSAIAEVRRYCETPSQPMSYIVGKLLILELKDDFRAARGEAFTPRAFHDELLRHGTIPVELIRREMGIPRRAPEKEILRVLSRTPRPLASAKRRPRKVAGTRPARA